MALLAPRVADYQGRDGVVVDGVSHGDTHGATGDHQGLLHPNDPEAQGSGHSRRLLGGRWVADLREYC